MMNVPKLRFKGFGEEWKIMKLKEIGIKKNKKNNDNKIIRVLTNSATQGIISQNDYFDRDIANKNNLQGYFIVENDDFIYNPRISSSAPVGPIKRNKIGLGIMSPLYTVFKTSNVNLDLLEVFFETNKWHNYLKEIANYGARSDRMNITNEGFFNLPIIFPSLPEQEKIASFFTAVDYRLEKLKKKKELLEQYKKGVMQKIFSQELRFKDEKGNNFQDWEDLILEDLLIEVVEKSKISNQEEVLSSTAKGIFKQSEYFNREIASSDNTGYKILRLNQLVFSPQNLWLGNINVNLKYNVGIVSPSYKIFKFSEKTNAIFCNYFLKLPRMINEYKISSVQGASVVRRNLEMEAFNNIKVKLPCIKEQQKIANFLTALDKKIDLVNQQITKTELWKKGLLQKMFV